MRKKGLYDNHFSRRGRGNFPVILLLIVLIITVIISTFLILLNQNDPTMRAQRTDSEAVTQEQEAAPAPEEVKETSSGSGSSLSSDTARAASTGATSARAASTGATSARAASGDAAPGAVNSVRSSTATAVSNRLPRSLPVRGEASDIEDDRRDAEAEERTREASEAEDAEETQDREETEDTEETQEVERTTDTRVQGTHLVSASSTPPNVNVSYDDIWKQISTQGNDYRYDASYDAAEKKANAIVDDAYISMTNLAGGGKNANDLSDALNRLSEVDVSSFAQSDKLVIQRSAYYLDWQNVTVTSYGDEFLQAYKKNDKAKMQAILRDVRAVYNEMAKETEDRYRVLSSY